MKRNCEHLGFLSSQTKRTKSSEASPVKNMLGIRELKCGSEYFESTPSEPKRRSNTEPPKHHVLEANTGNAESLLKTTEPQDRNESRGPQTGIMDLPPQLEPTLWKDLTFNDNAVSTRKVCSFLRRSPQLRKLTLCGRKDTDVILQQLLISNRLVKRIEICLCRGSRQRKKVQGDILSKIVKRSPKLCSLVISETVITGSSFYNALGQHHNRFKSLIMEKGMLKYFNDFLDGYVLSKHHRAEKKT
jgi:hypothetical protein